MTFKYLNPESLKEAAEKGATHNYVICMALIEVAHQLNRIAGELEAVRKVTVGR